MATKGTKNTSISFGDFAIEVTLAKAERSRDLKTEYVNEHGAKVTVGGARGGGSRTPAPGVEKAVRLSDTRVVRLPADEMQAIEDASRERWSAMEVLETIDYRQVPTDRITASYWLQPQNGTAQGLYLLHKGLSDTDKVAIVRWVGTSREKLGVIRPRMVKVSGGYERALLLSEVVFANDFADPDEDVLSINDAEAMLEDGDSLGHLRKIETARELVLAFARQPGDEKAIETASDGAVDARLALFGRLMDEQLVAALNVHSDLHVAAGEVVEAA